MFFYIDFTDPAIDESNKNLKYTYEIISNYKASAQTMEHFTYGNYTCGVRKKFANYTHKG